MLTDDEIMALWHQTILDNRGRFSIPFVRAVERAAVEREQDECAELCNYIGSGNPHSDAHDCADAIRALPLIEGSDDAAE